MRDDTIYRQAAIEAICKTCLMTEDYHKCDGYPETSTWCDELVALRALPSAEPKRKKGEWIRNDNGTYSCSICQSWIPEEQHHYARYCLYCGAKMKGETK